MDDRDIALAMLILDALKTYADLVRMLHEMLC